MNLKDLSYVISSKNTFQGNYLLSSWGYKFRKFIWFWSLNTFYKGLCKCILRIGRLCSSPMLSGDKSRCNPYFVAVSLFCTCSENEVGKLQYNNDRGFAYYWDGVAYLHSLLSSYSGLLAKMFQLVLSSSPWLVCLFVFICHKIIRKRNCWSWCGVCVWGRSSLFIEAGLNQWTSSCEFLS